MNIVDWIPSVHSRLCSKHFEEHCFYRVGQQKRLLDDAVPTVFDDFPKHLQTREVYVL